MNTHISPAAQARRIEITERATYTIAHADDIPGCRGIITDACTGRVTACYDGFRAVIGEPLMACCDQPVADGLCDCQRPALVQERAA